MRAHPLPSPFLASALACTAACVLAACAASTTGDGSQGASGGGKADNGSDAPTRATLTFDADWNETLEGELVAGGALRIVYAPERLECTGDRNGKPAWVLALHHRMNGTAPRATNVGGHESYPGEQTDTLRLPEAGELELWFENTSSFGCQGWDSNLGANYLYEVRGRGVAPAFLGNAAVVTSRQTCGDGGACDSDRMPAAGGFVYDAWVRERAAVRAVYFDAQKDGVTDFDNGDLWKTLNVQVHYRSDGEAEFETAPVDFSSWQGDAARYAVELRDFDPFAGPAPSDKSECPDVPLELVTDPGAAPGDAPQTVRARFEYYLTVNDVPLRAPGAVPFKGRFEAKAAAYAVCLGVR
jgi:hypothetical protein